MECGCGRCLILNLFKVLLLLTLIEIILGGYTDKNIILILRHRLLFCANFRPLHARTRMELDGGCYTAPFFILSDNLISPSSHPQYCGQRRHLWPNGESWNRRKKPFPFTIIEQRFILNGPPYSNYTQFG